eukprot:SAG11_NODE_15635_length_571_cov_0.980932_1_plen_61_part_00
MRIVYYFILVALALSRGPLRDSLPSFRGTRVLFALLIPIATRPRYVLNGTRERRITLGRD